MDFAAALAGGEGEGDRGGGGGGGARGGGGGDNAEGQEQAAKAGEDGKEQAAEGAGMTEQGEGKEARAAEAQAAKEAEEADEDGARGKEQRRATDAAAEEEVAAVVPGFPVDARVAPRWVWDRAWLGLGLGLVLGLGLGLGVAAAAVGIERFRLLPCSAPVNSLGSDTKAHFLSLLPCPYPLRPLLHPYSPNPHTPQVHHGFEPGRRHRHARDAAERPPPVRRRRTASAHDQPAGAECVCVFWGGGER